MSLKIVWIDTLYKVATGSRSVRNFFTPIGAIVYGLLIFVFVVIYINFWELKSIEEPELAKRLGEDYIKYRKRTPMFFPNLMEIFRKRE